MKFLVFVAFMSALSSEGFAPPRMTSMALHKTSVMMAAQVPVLPNFKLNDWQGKPIPRKGEKTTTPVAVRNLSWLEKQTMKDVMIEPDYLLSIAIALLGPLIIWYHPCKLSQLPRLFSTKIDTYPKGNFLCYPIPACK
jgi:hypothetical protein